MSTSTSEKEYDLETAAPTEGWIRRGWKAIRSKSATTTSTGYFRWKGWLDRSLAAVLLVPGIPLMALLIGMIRVTSRGPGVYRQIRVGRNGHDYRMYKLRTMSCGAEITSGPVWTQAKDPRVTRLGRILRKLHLDELPQLFNVIRGEMSLIGPPPEPPAILAKLSKAVAQ